MRTLDALNASRAAAGAPVAAVDLALHLGEVLYGNVGATDRLDFTVIGPVVNEVARIEALCEPLDRAVLVWAEPPPRRPAAAAASSRSAATRCAAFESRRRFLRWIWTRRLMDDPLTTAMATGRLQLPDNGAKRTGFRSGVRPITANPADCR